MTSVRPCARCGHLMASRRHAAQLGVRRSHTTLLCAYCCQALPQGRWTHARKTRDVDPIAVVRLLDGTLQQQPTSGELHEAIVRLDSYGLSARRIAERVGCSTRTVVRHRARAHGIRGAA